MNSEAVGRMAYVMMLAVCILFSSQASVAQTSGALVTTLRATAKEARTALKKWEPVYDELKGALVDEANEALTEDAKKRLSSREAVGYDELLGELDAAIAQVRKRNLQAPPWSNVSLDTLADPATCRAGASRLRQDLERANEELVAAEDVVKALAAIERQMRTAERVRKQFVDSALGVAILDGALGEVTGGSLYSEVVELAQLAPLDPIKEDSIANLRTFVGSAYRARRARQDIELAIRERREGLKTAGANVKAFGLDDGSLCAGVEKDCVAVRNEVDKRRLDAIERAAKRTKGATVAFFCRTDVIASYGLECSDGMIKALSCSETQAIEALGGSCETQRAFLRKGDQCAAQLEEAKRVCARTRPSKPLQNVSLPGSWKSTGICIVDRQRRDASAAR